MAPTSLVCFILIFTFPWLAVGREGSYGAAGLEAAQGRDPCGWGTQVWGCQMCWVPLAAHCQAPITSFADPSTHSITLGTSRPSPPDVLGCASPADTLRWSTMLLHHPTEQGISLPLPRPRCRARGAVESRIQLCFVFSLHRRLCLVRRIVP